MSSPHFAVSLIPKSVSHKGERPLTCTLINPTSVTCVLALVNVKDSMSWAQGGGESPPPFQTCHPFSVFQLSASCKICTLRWRPSLPNVTVPPTCAPLSHNPLAGRRAHLGGVKSLLFKGERSEIKDHVKGEWVQPRDKVNDLFQAFCETGLWDFSGFWALQVPSWGKTTGPTFHFQQGLYFPGMYG